MAWNSKNLWQQPDDTETKSGNGDKSKTISFKGKKADIEKAASSLSSGDEIASGWFYASHNIRSVNGGLALLSITCTPKNTPEEGETGSDQDLLKDIWSIRSVRNDVSIMSYCGISPGANPQRELVEAWMKEPDGDLAKNLMFRKPNGEEYEITEEPTKRLIEKIRNGVEAVIRFYPIVTRTRTYNSVPPACLERLGFIDTPPAPAGISKNPSGLATAINSHQWLKVQDDAQEQQDGKWTRIEAWMGIAKSDSTTSPWDPDLYGDNRWGMPYGG